MTTKSRAHEVFDYTNTEYINRRGHKVANYSFHSSKCLFKLAVTLNSASIIASTASFSCLKTFGLRMKSVLPIIDLKITRWEDVNATLACINAQANWLSFLVQKHAFPWISTMFFTCELPFC